MYMEMSEDFISALEKKTLLRELLKSEEFERHFRTSLRNRHEKLITYLTQVEVNEEDRTLQEASEVLGVILTNIEAINEALVTNHLSALFKYLDRATMNPRRLYFFLRVASFIFQNKPAESLKFSIVEPQFTARLVKHLSSPHIMQLTIHILNLERQMRETNVADCDWSKQTHLVGCIVESLLVDPAVYLESLYKFLFEITNSYTPHTQFVKMALVDQECALPRCIIQLTKNKAVSNEAIKMLDEIFFKIIMTNQDDNDFFETIKNSLVQECSIFDTMLESEDLLDVIVGVKYIHALIKHKASFLLNEKSFSCLDLCFKFPWANILHNVIVNAIIFAFQSEEETLIKAFLDAGLVKKIISGLASSDRIGYRSHLRMIAFSMDASQSPVTASALSDPLWIKFWDILHVRDDKDLTFHQAETKLRESLTCLLKNGPKYVPTQLTTSPEKPNTRPLSNLIGSDSEMKSEIPTLIDTASTTEIINTQQNSENDNNNSNNEETTQETTNEENNTNSVQESNETNNNDEVKENNNSESISTTETTPEISENNNNNEEKKENIESVAVVVENETSSEPTAIEVNSENSSNNQDAS